MSTAEASGSVVDIQDEKHTKGNSLTGDAIRRLRRNRFAMLGLFIIIVNIVMALGADFIAPQSFSTQVLTDNNGAPQWIIQLFPTMTPRDELFRARGDVEIVVETGDVVQTGDALIVPLEGSDDEGAVANMQGTIFADDTSVTITQSPVQDISIQAGWSVAVEAGATVAGPQITEDGATIPGDVILVNESTGETIQAQYNGTVYLLEGRLLVRSSVSGYVPLREQYTLGADALGRDLLSRIIYGARVSLMVAFVGPLVSLLIGVPYGLISGYFGGRVDLFMMNFVNLMYAFPTLLLIILLMSFFRTSFAGNAEVGTFTYYMAELDRSSGGMLFIFIGVGITSWMGLARLTRGQVLSIREQEYVTAARSIGAKRTRLMSAHILPNILGPIIVSETLTIPTYIRYEAFLSFIGLGVNPPTPSWGSMISEGAGVIRSYPNQALFPALALFFIMFAFNFLGDGIRDALDPRLRGTD